jgi:hypothetical protein
MIREECAELFADLDQVADALDEAPAKPANFRQCPRAEPAMAGRGRRKVASDVRLWGHSRNHDTTEARLEQAGLDGGRFE